MHTQNDPIRRKRVTGNITREKTERLSATITRLKTRPDTRPIQVADGWAGAEMRVSHFFTRDYGPTDRRTDQRTEGWTE